MTIKFIGKFVETDSSERYIGQTRDDMTDEEMEEFEEQKAKFERQLKENDAEYAAYAKFYSFEFVNDYLEENIDTKYVEKNMANLTFDKEAKEVEKK